MSLARFLARAAESYALIKHAIVAYLCRFAYNEPYAVVDENSVSYRGGRVNIDARFLFCAERYIECELLHTLLPKQVRITISTQGFIPCVRTFYDPAARGGGIFLHYDLQIALFCLGNFHCDALLFADFVVFFSVGFSLGLRGIILPFRSVYL